MTRSTKEYSLERLLHNHQDTSIEAAESVEVSRDIDAGRIYREIVTAGDLGMTCDEVEVTFEMVHQTASARIYDLRKRDFLKDSGLRRPTRTGRKAIVWVNNK